MRLGFAFLAWCLYAHIAVSYWTTKVQALNPLEHGDAVIKRVVSKSVAFLKDDMDMLDTSKYWPSDKDSSKSKPPIKNSYLLGLFAAKSKHAVIKRGVGKSVAFIKDNMDVPDRDKVRPPDKDSSKLKPPMKTSHFLGIGYGK